MGAMLGAFDIKYLPQTVMKVQVLADLVAEFNKELGDLERIEGPKEARKVDSVIVQ